MDDLSTVKPLYPGAFSQSDVGEDDAPYPKAPLNLTLGFDLETFQIPLEELMPSKKVPDGVMTTRKFKQILSSIREIGLIEPLSVTKLDPEAAGFLLLDGNLRVLALKELGQGNAPCLIAKAFETYTYNHRINRLSTVQEHYMLWRAIDKGVSKEQRTDYKPPQPEQPKGDPLEQTVKLEREMSQVPEKYKHAEENYGSELLNLVVAKGYLKKPMENEAVRSYVARHAPEILEQFELVLNTVSMEEAVEQGGNDQIPDSSTFGSRVASNIEYNLPAGSSSLTGPQG